LHGVSDRNGNEAIAGVASQKHHLGGCTIDP